MRAQAKRRVYGGSGASWVVGTRSRGVLVGLGTCSVVPGLWSVFQSVEEREIAWLEYKLGRGKKNSAALKGKEQDGGDESDGLDELLDDLDRLEAEALGMDSESEMESDEGMEDEEVDMSDEASEGSAPEVRFAP